jgi:nitrate reductase gamma subunit
MVLHAGVFSAVAWLALALAWPEPPFPLRAALGIVQIAGALAGTGLIVRRVRSPILRIVSTADDYASPSFVILFLASAAASTRDAAVVPLFLTIAVALAVYTPFSKLRHCVLFFFARTRYGLFMGQRGVFGARSGGA